MEPDSHHSLSKAAREGCLLRRMQAVQNTWVRGATVMSVRSSEGLGRPEAFFVWGQNYFSWREDGLLADPGFLLHSMSKLLFSGTWLSPTNLTVTPAKVIHPRRVGSV